MSVSVVPKKDKIRRHSSWQGNRENKTLTWFNGSAVSTDKKAGRFVDRDKGSKYKLQLKWFWRIHKDVGALWRDAIVFVTISEFLNPWVTKPPHLSNTCGSI